MQKLMARLSGLKTRQKILFGVIFPLVMMLVVGAVGIVNIQAIIKSNQQLMASGSVLTTSKDVLTHAGDMVQGVRGYLLAGKDSFLMPYESGRSQTEADIASLREVVGDDADSGAMLDKAQEILARWQQDAAKPAIDLRRDIGDAETMNDMARLVGKAEGKEYFDRFRAEIDSFVNTQEKLLEGRRERFASSSEKLEENVVRLQEISEKLDERREEIELIEGLQAAANAMESSLRGYVISGRKETLDTYKKDLVTFRKTAKKLEKAFSERADEMKLVKRFVTLINNWDKTAVKATRTIRVQITKGEVTLEEIKKFYDDKLGMAAFAELRDGISKLLNSEEKLLQQIAEERDDAEFEVEGAIVVMKYEETQVSALHKIVGDAGQVLETAINMETGMRGYLLAGRSEFLTPYQEGRKVFSKQMDELKALIPDEPEQLEILEKASAVLADWDGKVVQPMIQLRRQIGAAATMDDMADLVGQEKGRKYMDQFQGVMAGFIAGEQQVIAGLVAENMAIQQRTFWMVGGCTVLALVLGLGIAVLVGNGISRPLVRMTGEMKQLAEGDTGLKIHGTERGDEIGAMAVALRVFRDNARQNERLMADQKRQEEENAERDRRDAERQVAEEKARQTQAEAAERDKRETMLRLATRFEDSIGSVVSAVAKSASELQTSAETMSATAAETNSEAEQAGAATDSTLQNVRSVSGAAADLNSSISEIAQQVTRSTDTASRAVEEAQKTGDVVSGLSTMVNKIGDVLEMINDIAGQTNLLALNATIEASRAGDAGKGFAVVASEVKNLAGQTAKATEEIASHITAVQGATSDTVSAMTMIGTTISDVNVGIAAIAAAVEEQGAATASISGNVETAARESEGVANSISTVREAANSSGAAAQQVLSAAGVMDEQAERLHTEVEQFLAEVRAA